MLRLTRTTSVGGVLYGENPPVSDIKDLTPGERTSLVTSGYLLDDGKTEKPSKSKATNEQPNEASAEQSDSADEATGDAQTSDAAASPETASQDSPALASPAKPKRTRTRR